MIPLLVTLTATLPENEPMTPNCSLIYNASGDLPFDGFAAWRFVHWLVKVATGAALTLPVYWLGGVWWALGAAIGSLLICKSFNIKWTMPHSTWTLQRWTPLTLDFVFDCTLNLVPWLLLAGAGWPVWLVAVAILGATYPFVSP
jgi:hypothetical protein